MGRTGRGPEPQLLASEDASHGRWTRTCGDDCTCRAVCVGDTRGGNTQPRDPCLLLPVKILYLQGHSMSRLAFELRGGDGSLPVLLQVLQGPCGSWCLPGAPFRFSSLKPVWAASCSGVVGPGDSVMAQTSLKQWAGCLGPSSLSWHQHTARDTGGKDRCPWDAPHAGVGCCYDVMQGRALSFVGRSSLCWAFPGIKSFSVSGLNRWQTGGHCTGDAREG